MKTMGGFLCEVKQHPKIHSYVHIQAHVHTYNEKGYIDQILYIFIFFGL